MTTPHVGTLLAIATLALSTLATIRWRAAAPVATPSVALRLPPALPAAHLDDDSLASATASIVDDNLFRLSRTPPEVSYDPGLDGAAATVSTHGNPRPTLLLRAIVGGPPWQAVIDGLPGQPPGTIIRQGSTFDHLVVRLVTRDSVVIQSPDTTWTLDFRKRS